MKAKILNSDGKEGKEIELPPIFFNIIREDIAQKYFEIEKKQQPYAPSYVAGKQHSASGIVRHARHKWKTAYGRGISRIPRKIFWRRGTQFYWVGAEISGTVGGRKAHPPKLAHFKKKLKINKKEKLIAISSALSSTALSEYVKRRYETLEEIKVPYIVESEILKLKTKAFLLALKNILGENYQLAIKKKKIRAGKGKMRGRKYKVSAGLLLVIGKDEEKKVSGIEVRKANELAIEDLWPLGRLAIYTEKAISDLDELWKKEVKETGRKRK